MRRATALVLALALALAAAGCGQGAETPAANEAPPAPATAPHAEPPREPPPEPPAPPAVDLYAATRPNQLSPVVTGIPARVYVPNSESHTVDVIDPATNQLIDHFPVGAQPQHVTPSHDLRTLWVGSAQGNTLTPIDPATGRPGPPVPVDDPYNLYFTPDGSSAIVVAERLRRLDFRDPHTMHIQTSLEVPCEGVDHLDFSADGTFLLASCEFSGELIRVDLGPRQIAGVIQLAPPSKPQDVKLSPDGRTFYVADMDAGGLWRIDAEGRVVAGFVPTSAGAHGLYVSRDSKDLYISNRHAGSVSVLSLAIGQVVATWPLPGGGSPDMGGVSADGRALWLSGRHHGEVYAIDVTNGQLLQRIPVGAGPHGLCVYPQPGRYSLGHTGVFR